LPAPRKPLRIVTGMGEDNWNLLFHKVKKQHKTNVGASLLAMATVNQQ
jgi:hypothetical protein